MKKIQIYYDPFTVTPSDTRIIESKLSKFDDKFIFTFSFDSSELDETLPTLRILNENIFKSEITDEDRGFLTISHLDLLETSVLKIEELINEK